MIIKELTVITIGHREHYFKGDLILDTAGDAAIQIYNKTTNVSNVFVLRNVITYRVVHDDANL